MCTASTFPVSRLCLIKHEIIISVPPRKFDVSAKLCENASPFWLTSPSVEGEGREKLHVIGLGRQILHAPMKAKAEGSVQRLTCHHSPRSLQPHHVQH